VKNEAKSNHILITLADILSTRGHCPKTTYRPADLKTLNSYQNHMLHADLSKLK